MPDTWQGEEIVVDAVASAGRRRASLVIGGILALAVVLALWPSGGGEEDAVGQAGPGAAVVYEVRSGQSVRSVGDDLAELDVIGSTLRFRRVAEEAGLAAVLRPGRFELTTGIDRKSVV